MPDLAREIIIEACCDAIRLWEFGNPNVTKPELAMSDMELLEYFGGAWIDLQKRGKAIAYDTEKIMGLIHTCEIKKVLIHNPKLDECSKFISSKRFGKLMAASENKSIAAKSDYGIKFITDLGKKLSSTGGDQPALASRLLFFAVPQATIFNYSAPLISKLKKRYSLADSSLKEVGRVMTELYKHHYKELSELPRPKFPSKLNKSIKDGGWWERRVLDLAILNHMR